MTIYKPKPSDGKVDVKKTPLKAAVVVDDVKPLAKSKTTPAATVRVIQARRRRSGLLLVGCIVLLVFIILMVAAVGSYFLIKHLATQKSHHVETAEVKYYEYQRSDALSHGERRRVQLGSFVETIEFDDDDFVHERLDVPPILESRRSTVVHDFEKNLTAIVDRDNERCFVMQLNRTAVKPPRSFMDLMIKYRSGYYLPDAEVVRDNYKVQLPAVDNIESFGFYIWFDCHSYETYRLVHDDAGPRMLSKRSACELAGDSYCLGNSGSSQMICLKITSCM